jgi:ATP-dependent protease ClpP protease subunit
MSAGLLLLLAGQERYCLKRSQALIHTGSGGLQGTYEQIEESQKSYKKMVDEMRDYIIERTSIDLKTFNKNKAKDWYLTSAEQIEYSICNKIISCLDEII